MFNDYYSTSLDKKDFERLSTCIYKESGIKMPPSKRIMLEARLRKRLRELNFNSFSSYCDFLFTKEGMGSELVHMIDVVTTNKTDFFREPKQFEFLYQKILPALTEFYNAGTKRNLRIWSAGCSTGEEPYTIAIVVKEFARSFQQYNFNILATDISTQVLNKAASAIYETEKIKPVPEKLFKSYFLKSKDDQQKLVRVCAEIRNKVTFHRLNFMDEDFCQRDVFDIIFCRNVIIYFDKQTQEKLLTKLVDKLIPGGFLLLGHSETIVNMNLPVHQVMASTYRKSP